MLIRVFLMAVAVLTLVSPSYGESTPSAGSNPPRLIQVKTPSGTVIQAEIADTPQKRATGLMYSDHLKKDHGMMFFFDQAQEWTFWMKNTLIPLDMLFVDEYGCVVKVQRDARPGSLDTIQSGEPVVLVVELAGGTAKILGLTVGDRVVRPDARWPAATRACQAN